MTAAVLWQVHAEPGGLVYLVSRGHARDESREPMHDPRWVFLLRPLCIMAGTSLTPSTHAAGRKRKAPRNDTAASHARATPKRQQREAPPHRSPKLSPQDTPSPLDNREDTPRSNHHRVENSAVADQERCVMSPSPPMHSVTDIVYVVRYETVYCNTLTMYVLFQDSYKACEDDPVLVADLVDQHYWLGKGKVAGRMGEMFDSFKPILEQGIKRDPEIDQRTLYNEL